MTASQLLALSLTFVGVSALCKAQATSSPAQSEGRQTYEHTLAQYLSDQDTAKARLGYLTAIEQDPLMVGPRLKLAALAISQQDWKEAATRLREVLQIGTTPTNQIAAIRNTLKTLLDIQRFGSPGIFSALDPSVEPPNVIAKTDPQYTNDARNARVKGNVLVWLEVDENGFPDNLQIVEGLGHGLNEKAIKAVSQWRFKPATKDGRVVRCGAVVTINFRI